MTEYAIPLPKVKRRRRKPWSTWTKLFLAFTILDVIVAAWQFAGDVGPLDVAVAFFLLVGCPPWPWTIYQMINGRPWPIQLTGALHCWTMFNIHRWIDEQE